MPSRILGLSRPNFLRVVIYPLAAAAAATLLWLGFREAPPGDAQVLRGAEAIMGIKPNEAIAEVRKLLARQPDHAPACITLGRAIESRYFKRDVWQAKIAEHEAALKQDISPEYRKNTEANLASCRKTLAELGPLDEARDRREANEAYERALRLAPTVDNHLSVCQTHAHFGRLDRALELAEKTRRLAGVSAERKIELDQVHARILGELAAREKDPARATRLFAQAVDLHLASAAGCEKELLKEGLAEKPRLRFERELALALHHAGLRQAELGRALPALDSLRRAASLQPGELEYSLHLARHLLRLGNPLDALHYYLKAAGLQNAEVWYELALVWLRLLKKDQTLQYLDRAMGYQIVAVTEWMARDQAQWAVLAGDPDFERLTGYGSPVSLFRLRRLAEASQAALLAPVESEAFGGLAARLAALDKEVPGLPALTLVQGQLALRLERERGALETQRAALRESLKSAGKLEALQVEARLDDLARRSKSLAQAASRLGQGETSASAFERALAQRRDRTMLAAVGISYLHLRAWSEAIRHLEAALALARPGWETTNLAANLGWAALQAGNQERAMAAYQQALAGGENGAIRNMIGDLQLQMGRPEAAEQEFRRALALVEVPYYRLQLGRALLARGQLPGARAEFEGFFRRWPWHFSGAYYLAVVSFHEGERAAALEMFHQLRDRDPGELAGRVRQDPFWKQAGRQPEFAELVSEVTGLEAAGGPDKK